SSPAVDVAGNVREAPLVLDDDALYLQRLWRAEQRLAERVAELDVPAPLGEPSAVAGVVDSLFAPAEADDAQRRALLRALGHRLTLLSGGPGTGKTTTLARLLVAFARLAPDARVAFAAPTGKASARLGQSLSDQLARLDPSGELRARLPEAGMTVHRLLGRRAGGAVAAPAWDQPPSLDYDLVLVDEASMLDIEIAAALVSAAGPNVRLVLAGDRDQLASVEAGAVFADLCASAGDAMVELERNHRQKDAAHIVELAVQVRDASLLAREGARCGPAPFRWPEAIALRRPDPAAIVDDALAAWAEVREAIDARASPALVLAACERHRVLTALRRGPLGSVALNHRIAAAVRRHAGRSGARPSTFAPWYAGRLVLVTANRPTLGLFNGDVGVCVPGPGADDDAGSDLVVAFADAGAPRLFPVAQMPACEDAWAMTVHKSQGSEFESVALVLAPHGHALNTRELVYTGITRARNRLAMWAESDAVEAAALTRTERHGRLAQRLAARIGDRNAE
ncbi:MAG TPA: exodeoxyribonuclease V subunit alpha, partial [Zeimonas sp.]